MKTTARIGRRIYGVGVAMIGALCLAWGDFVPGQPVPVHFPGRTILAYVAGAFLIAAGAALQWRRTAVWAAAYLAAYYAVVVVLLMNGRPLLAHYREYGAYSSLAEQLSLATGALILFAMTAEIETTLDARLKRVGLSAFGFCALLFGGAHFVYMNLTAPLVPKWLPPSQVFWGYATGSCFLAAGIALLTGIQARLAAILLTAMIVLFAVLIHEPTLLADWHSRWNWSESALNLAIAGVAWVAADSLARPKRQV